MDDTGGEATGGLGATPAVVVNASRMDDTEGSSAPPSTEPNLLTDALVPVADLCGTEVSTADLEDLVLGWMTAGDTMVVESRALIEPLLAARLENVRSTLLPLRDLGASILAEPLPDRLTACLHPAKG
ncbi:MAG: hypothetical protein EA406_09545 [Rhodospirillales bacterium]|nr:MAG: hypothetical protein EA406_09545 [Rhodospirillales bacterium]